MDGTREIEEGVDDGGSAAGVRCGVVSRCEVQPCWARLHGAGSGASKKIPVDTGKSLRKGDGPGGGDAGAVGV